MDQESMNKTSQTGRPDLFYVILDKIRELHDKKAKDYGSDNDPLANIRAATELGIPGWKGCLLRLNDKVHRLKVYAKRGNLANESAEDSMIDIAVYAIIMLQLHKEETTRGL